jgi:hypothetical protein
MIIWQREGCRAHAFQSWVSGSSTDLTRALFAFRALEAESRRSAGPNRVVADVNGMIVAGIEASQIVLLKVVSWF